MGKENQKLTQVIKEMVATANHKKLIYIVVLDCFNFVCLCVGCFHLFCLFSFKHTASTQMYTSIWWFLRVLPVLHRPEKVDTGVNTI